MGFGSEGIEAGKAFVKYVLDDSELNGQLARIGGKLTSIAGYGLAAGTAIAAVFTAATAVFVDVGNELFELSEKTGISTEALSELRFAANLTGVDMDTLTRAFKNLQKQGIDPKRFKEIAAQIRAIPDATVRAQIAMEYFGKSGQALIPLIEGLPEATEKFRQFGSAISSESAAKAHELFQEFQIGKLEIEDLGISLGAAVAGPLKDFVQWLETTKPLLEWFEQHSKAIGIGLRLVFAPGTFITDAPAALVNGANLQGSTQINSLPGSAPRGNVVPRQESAEDVVDRLDQLINLARTGGTVAGVG
jgi:hypothetical protein